MFWELLAAVYVHEEWLIPLKVELRKRNFSDATEHLSQARPEGPILLWTHSSVNKESLYF